MVICSLLKKNCLVLNVVMFSLDLHCSSEEDDLMEVVGDHPPDDDSQQVAEAMVLLGNIGYNPAPETYSNHIQGEIGISY